MSTMMIAKLLDEDLNLVDCVSFRDRSQFAAWLTRTPINAGDRIFIVKGGRARVEATSINGDGDRSVIPFPPPKEDHQ